MSAAASVSILSFRLDRMRSKPSFTAANAARSLVASGASRHAAAAFGLRWQRWILQTSRSCHTVGRSRAGTSVGGSAHSADAAFESESPKAAASTRNVNMLEDVREMFDSKWLSGVNILTVSAGTFILAISSYLSSLRVSKQFHTWPQVIVGAIFGSLYAALWLWSWDAFMQAASASSVWLRALLILATIGYQVQFVGDVAQTWSRSSLA